MKNAVRSLPDALLILLYVYAASSKLLDFGQFRSQLHNQTFGPALAGVLLVALPPAELLTALLVAWQRTRRYGLWASLALLLTFTAYIALVKLHFWARVPCSCGGVLSHMGWTAHLLFNLCFIVINVIAIRQTGEAENPVQSRRYPFT